MPRKPKILKDFSRYTDSEIDDFAQGVIDGLTANADFPTPQPTVAVLTTAKNEYTTALAAAGGGGEMETQIKNQQRVALEDVLAQEADYVDLASGGDAAKILSTGFKVSKTPQPQGERARPGNVRVTSPAKGQLDCRCDPVDGARMYDWSVQKQNSTDAPIRKQTPSAKLLLTDLQSGAEYGVKVVSLGTNPILNWSDEIKSFVL
ncbi:MAG: hypothetical protein ABI675_14460 [Chitinophagaceae bacterium]